jgi:hypothetical protein
MAFTSNHVTGFIVGLGAAAAGFVLYKRNQDKVDEFLRSKGIALPGSTGRDEKSMSMEDLVSEKERLEDLIAEREYAAKQQAEAAEPKEPAKAK